MSSIMGKPSVLTTQWTSKKKGRMMKKSPVCYDLRMPYCVNRAEWFINNINIPKKPFPKISHISIMQKSNWWQARQAEAWTMLVCFKSCNDLHWRLTAPCHSWIFSGIDVLILIDHDLDTNIHFRSGRNGHTYSRWGSCRIVVCAW